MYGVVSIKFLIIKDINLITIIFNVFNVGSDINIFLLIHFQKLLNR